MKFLFTAPRFHTNQVPIVKGLVEKGHEVRYFVAFCGATEDHDLCKPIVLNMSRCMQRKVKAYKKNNNESSVESYIGSQFTPDMRLLEREFVQYNPDVVICRENTRFTLCVHYLCKKYNVPCVMYDQQPYYDLTSVKNVGKVNIAPKSSLKFLKRIYNKISGSLDSDKRLVKRLKKSVGFPNVRMTPVLVSGYVKDLSNAPICKNTYFLPFVGELCELAEKRSYMDDGVLRILCVGKYREYKNLPLFIKSISMLPRNCNFKATVLGQVSSDDEQQYFCELQKQNKELRLENIITLEKNVPHEQMSEVYLKHDILVLPTKREWASISVIEAMAHGLAVISTDHNGYGNLYKSACLRRCV